MFPIETEYVDMVFIKSFQGLFRWHAYGSVNMKFNKFCQLISKHTHNHATTILPTTTTQKWVQWKLIICMIFLACISQ